MKIIFKTARSVTIELSNNSCYYALDKYQVYLNNSLVINSGDKNVFSLYDLTPGTTYNIKLTKIDSSLNKYLKFTTKKEPCCLNIKDFKAVGDGIADDTNAIVSAINVAPKDSTIIIPAGTYKIAPIWLKSHLNIYLEKGATILGETDRLHYPILPAQVKTAHKLWETNSWEGSPQATFVSLISGFRIKKVAIYGQGIIDENAQNSDWWLNHKEIRGAARPKGIFLSHCQDISLQGITITNTPSWNIHPFFSSKINLINIQLINPKNSPNTDGFDPESCHNIKVIGVYFSVGDDCIAIKSGKFAMGMKYKTPTSKMVIRNCYMRDGHGAVVLGSEMSGGIKNLTITKCLFENTDRGLRIKTRRGRGKTGIINNITFDNIVMKNVLTPFVINMFYFCDDDGKTPYVWSKDSLPVDERTPYLGHFTFKNIICQGVSVAAGFFYGLPERKIASITLKNIQVTYAKNPLPFAAAMMSFLEPFTLHGFEFRNVLVVKQKNLTIEKTKEQTFIYEGVKKVVNG
ncbi:MAG: glycoside hydrolase family 28 protein [Acholeplasmatales bacterium]|jgi:polygalacturonase|nr:glycoside hydrolase family 28 protein [Acholeplasmatales bacterium]